MKLCISIVCLFASIAIFATPSKQEVMSTVKRMSDEMITNGLVQSFDGDAEKAETFKKELNEITESNEAKSNEAKSNEVYALLEKHSLNENAEKFAAIHRKYQHVLEAASQLFEDPEYLHEVALLTEEYQSPNKEYVEAYTRLISKRIPEYALYLEELATVSNLL